jgi:small-conductance mechanosensitive channel
VGFSSWAAGSFRWYGLLDPISDAVRRWFSLEWTIGSMTISVQNVVAFIVTLWISVLVSRLIRAFLKDDVLPKARLARGMPETISLVVHYGIVAIGFFLALAAAGIEMSQFAILAGAFGVGIGFGLQTVVNNFISGLILVFERPINVGDTIQIGTLTGVVRRIGIRASTVRTFSGAEVIVPNGSLLAGELINWTLSDVIRRVEIPVGVAYGTDPKTVLELLVNVAAEHGDVLKSPEPNALFKGFGESSLDFELRIWAASDRWWIVQSEVTVAICDALAKANIEIPFPQRDLHVRSVDRSIKNLAERVDGRREDENKTTE